MPGLKHHIIGLCGLAYAGKDTVGDLLIMHAGFRKLAFADGLRGEVADAFHVEPIYFTRRESKDQPMEALALSRSTKLCYVGAVLAHLGTTEPDVPTNEQLVRARSPRWTLQMWGTQYRRAQDPDYWVKQARGRIRYYMHDLGERNFAICDTRFNNEAAMVREMGGQIWQVVRPGVTTATTPEGAHASTNDGSAFAPDAVLHNDGDILALRQQVLGEFWALDAGLDSAKLRVEIAA